MRPMLMWLLVEGELSAIVGKVNELVSFYMRRGSKVGVLCTDETARLLSG